MVSAVLLGSTRVKALKGICGRGVEVSEVVALMEAPEPEDGAVPVEECT